MPGDPLVIRDRGFEAEAVVKRPGSEPVANRSELRLAGNADSSSVTQLQSLISDLHGAMIGAGISRLDVDIKSLEFMNASCFNVLVTWVNIINELPPEQRYQLHFATNPAIPWQRRSIRTLSCFATDLVLVES